MTLGCDPSIFSYPLIAVPVVSTPSFSPSPKARGPRVVLKRKRVLTFFVPNRLYTLPSGLVDYPKDLFDLVEKSLAKPRQTPLKA